MGLADHVWSDKRKSIAQSVDNLGDQFRPAMRASWISYISRVYREEEGAADVGLVLLREKTPSWLQIVSTPLILLHATNTVRP